MAGHLRFTAVLDACVLYPISVADALLSLATADLFAAKWSRQIEEEWMRNVVAKRPELIGKLDYRRDAMRQAVPDWEVDPAACRSIESSLVLPDRNDLHVLAAAIGGHADCIVTYNLKDFPDRNLAQYGVCAIHPDDFIIAQFDLDEISALRAMKRMRSRAARPPIAIDEFLAAFRRNHLLQVAERLAVAADLI
ncbi:MAG: PIN domain-containing protein [Ahniella sp.]|nr:PIN domain-containing protein [Ahniella sp.]